MDFLREHLKVRKMQILLLRSQPFEDMPWGESPLLYYLLLETPVQRPLEPYKRGNEQVMSELKL